MRRAEKGRGLLKELPPTFFFFEVDAADAASLLSLPLFRKRGESKEDESSTIESGGGKISVLGIYEKGA